MYFCVCTSSDMYVHKQRPAKVFAYRIYRVKVTCVLFAYAKLPSKQLNL